ncbi:MAG: Fic/DOC family N-terminal domain-containing protein [Egibacteraceae bacterium]
MSRRGREGCEYEAYVPDPLAGRAFRLDGAVAADVADAEAAIARLNAAVATLVDTEALARLLLRAESVGSSRIEGLWSVAAGSCERRPPVPWASPRTTLPLRRSSAISRP